jgi:acyl-CoA dehydrogenase
MLLCSFQISDPKEYGGSALGTLSLAIVIEEIARVCASTAHMITTQAFCADALALKGTHEQKLRWLEPMAKGDILGACAITEPEAGSDVIGMKTSAAERDGGYLIDGCKRFITHGGVAEIVIVAAYTDRAKRHKGISLFVVPKGTPGFSVGNKERRGSWVCAGPTQRTSSCRIASLRRRTG